MNRFRVTVLVGLVAILLFAGATDALAQHFRFTRTNASVSIIVQSATLDGQGLVAGDEIGVFAPSGQCAGAAVIPQNGFPVGVAAWGAEGDQDYFRANNPLVFRIWDSDAEAEWPAEITSCINGFSQQAVNPIWIADDFLMIRLAAVSEELPDIDLSAFRHDFGALRVGLEATWDFTVTNRGQADLTVSGMAIDEGPFSVNFGEEIVLGPGESNDFTVTFAPEEAGEWESTLAITSDDPDEEVVNLTLIGSAQDALPPTINLSANERRFGRVLVDQSRDWVLVIRNTGDAPLVISDISINNEVFSSSFDGEFEIGEGASSEVTVTFTPPAVQAYNGVMTITSNDPNNEVVNVNLFGEGIEAGEPPVIAVLEQEHFFGKVTNGTSSMWRLVIMNNGGSDLMVSAVTSGHQVFSVDFPRVAQRVRPGDYLYVPVTFAPNADGFYYSRLTIVSNDEENGEYSVRVGGVGESADGRHFRFHRTDGNHSLIVLATTLNGNALGQGNEVGVFTTRGFCAGAAVIAQDGRAGVGAWRDDNATEIIDGFVNGEMFSFKVWDNNARIEAWGTPEYVQGPQVFSPDELTILRLNARTVEVPDIDLSANRYYYGQVRVEDSEEWVFRITNRGRGALNVAAIESDFDEFTTDVDGAFELNFAEGRDITVTFAPSGYVDYAARLTVLSNDPMDSVLYIDLFGQGVDEVREPELSLPRADHFFGVKRIGGRYEYVLPIVNRGGGRLRIDEIQTIGAGFSTNWPGQPVQVEPGEQFDLTVTFAPVAAQQYNGSLRILSDDPNNEDISFALWGIGTAAQTHFAALQTNISHSILVENVVVVTPANEENPLFPNDEIALFTPRGLCAGVTVVQAQGSRFGISAYGDNPGTPFDDGFRNGDAFLFRIWDNATRTEIVPEVEWLEGQQVFTVDGASRVNLRGVCEVEAAQITIDPPIYQFGPVKLQQSLQHTFRVSNIGGVDLTVTRVASNLNAFTSDFNQARVLRPGEGFDLVVTFRPTQTLGYEGILTITSDDPRRPNFTFNPCGTGANEPGHYQWYNSGANHSIIVRSFMMGGAAAPEGDEIGVFTPAGHCAGSEVVVNPGQQIGLAAMGDEGESRILIEGFRHDELIQFRVWDASQEREYVLRSSGENPEVTVVAGDLTWENFGFSIVNVNVPDVFSAYVIDNPQQPITVRETDVVTFDLGITNPPGRMQWEMLAAERFDSTARRWVNVNLDNRGEITLEEVRENVARFTWETNYNAAGEYRINVRAFNDDGGDRVSVKITVLNVNRAPAINNNARLENDVFVVAEDSGIQDVLNLSQLFVDPDGDTLIFAFQAGGPGAVAGIITRQGQRIFQLTPSLNFFGEIQYTVSADDTLGLPRRILRVASHEIPKNSLAQSSAMDILDDGNVSGPVRDLTERYVFTYRVTPVNDPPVIVEPANAAQFNINAREFEELIVNFRATDVDNDANTLRWVMFDRGNLPEPARFVDNEDGTARLSWTPNENDAGVYRPQFRVTDPGGATDEILVIITVANVNRPPRVANPIQDFSIENENFLVEDQDRQVLANLNQVFEDPDGDALQFSLVDNPSALRLQIAQVEGSFLLSSQPAPDSTCWPPRAPHRVTVRASDGPNNVTTSFLVQIQPVNDAPRWTGKPNDQRFAEDTQNRRNIVNIANIVRDVDNVIADIRFRIEAPEELGLQITQAPPFTLSFQLARDYNTYKLPNRVAVCTIVAIDPNEAENDTTFTFEVTPVNDPLAFDENRPFVLVNPENNYNIPYDPDSLGTLTFRWRMAPNPWEIDTTRYFVSFRLDARPDTFAVPIPLLDTTYADVPFQQILDLITGQNRFVNRQDAHYLTWWVWARKDDQSVLRANNAPFRFNIPPLSVRRTDELTIPNNFTMAAAYPNPFNASTTLKFGLPMPETVEISVWDMHGRQVATLSPGYLQAGQYEIVWEAYGMTSGIYIFKMSAGNYHATQKAILVR